MQKVHLDTDLGGDLDDLRALALLLRWPEIDLIAVTTAAEASGRRTGFVRYALQLAGRNDVPVAAGAGLLLIGAEYVLVARLTAGLSPHV
jgi:inosine-uridine nucleoside N-ribohydrolase